MPTDAEVCPGTSKALLDAARACICNGPCQAQCDGKAQLCGGSESPAGCLGCEGDAQNGCGVAWMACLADHG
jgi:hypothetical protein